MAPAIITIGYKYELNSNENDKVLKKLYDDCFREFSTQMRFIQNNGFGNVDDIKYLRPDLQQGIINTLNGMVQNIRLRENFMIPLLIDESLQVKFKPSTISYQIKEGDLKTKVFEMFLFFTSEPLTLIGSLEDKFIIAVGDKSEDIRNGNEIKDIVFLKYCKDIWITNNKKIHL